MSEMWDGNNPLSGFRSGNNLGAIYLRSLVYSYNLRGLRAGANETIAEVLDCSVVASGTSMLVSVGNGVVGNATYTANVLGGNLTVPDSDGTYDRYDLVVGSYNAGNYIAVLRTGIAISETGLITRRPNGTGQTADIPFAIIHVAANATVIEQADILDIRSFVVG